jgi:protein SCO1/2
MTNRSHLLLFLALGLALALAACSGAPRGATTQQLVSSTASAATTGTPPAMQPAADGHADHSHHEALPASEPLPGRSLYHLNDTWLDQRGAELQLHELRGQPVVAVMFYASCETACPILIRDALQLERELPAADRERTQFVMITIDPETDAPERMTRYVSDNGLEAPNWHFLSGSEQQTRAIASLLGVSYRAAGGGMFSHTNLITILDPDGVVVHRTEGLAQPTAPAVRVITAMK